MKFKKTLMTAGALLATLFTVSTAAADSNVQKVIDETYVQPEYVLGYSLDESQNSRPCRCWATIRPATASHLRP